MRRDEDHLTPINGDIDDINGDIDETPKYSVYKKRWLILFIYAFNSMANALLFACISAINDLACKYWSVGPDVVDWLPNSFVLIYVFIALPSAYFISKFGLRLSMIVASSLNAISASLHFAGYQQEQFVFIMTGQIAAALSVGIILQLPARLSTVWFPEHEHAKATGIGIFMNIFGVAIAFLQPAQMIPDSPDYNVVKAGMFNMFLSQLIFLLICVIVVYLFFDEQPKTPPSHAAAATDSHHQQMDFLTSLRELVSNLNFNILVHMYGLYFGMYIFFSIVLNEMVKGKVLETDIGWMGFSADVFAILGVMINAWLIDKFQCYKVLSMVVMFFSLVSWLVFSFLLLHTDSRWGLFAAFSCVGFFGIPYFATGVEQAAEMTYPVPEGTSSAVILIAGNMYGFIFVLFFGAWIDHGRLAVVCYITIGIYAAIFILSCIMKTTLRRQGSEVDRILTDDDAQYNDTEYAGSFSGNDGSMNAMA